MSTKTKQRSLPSWQAFLDGKVEVTHPVTTKEVWDLHRLDGEHAINLAGGREAGPDALIEALEGMFLGDGKAAFPMQVGYIPKDEFDLQKWQFGCIDKGKELFLEEGYLTPILHIVGDGGDQMVSTHMALGPLFYDDVTTEMKILFCRDVIKPLLEEHKAICYIFGSECWAHKSESLGGEDIERLRQQYGSLEHAPNKTEALMFHVETRFGGKTLMTEIKRDGDAVSLSEGFLPEIVKSAKVRGAFMGLLHEEEVAEA